MALGLNLEKGNTGSFLFEQRRASMNKMRHSVLCSSTLSLERQVNMNNYVTKADEFGL